MKQNLSCEGLFALSGVYYFSFFEFCKFSGNDTVSILLLLYILTMIDKISPLYNLGVRELMLS